MKDLTQQYLHEARDTLPKVRKEFTDTNSMNASLCERGFAGGVELTIKAYEFEMTGKITHTHSMTAICQSCGLWGLLPAEIYRAPFKSGLLSTRMSGTQIRNSITRL
jgi:hypothetical protein